MVLSPGVSIADIPSFICSTDRQIAGLRVFVGANLSLDARGEEKEETC